MNILTHTFMKQKRK